MKITVIIPVYNTEKYLHRCLESVCNQTFKDLEIICINDCSTDKSLEILNEYAMKDSRIKVLNNISNLKAAKTRNVGLDNASGDYVYFLDADDYIDDDYLQQMYDKAEHEKADIVMNTNILTETDEKVVPYRHPSMPTILDSGEVVDSVVAIERSFCAIWMRLYRRQFLEKYQIRFSDVHMTEDNVFHYVTNIHAAVIFAFNGVSSYHYVIRDDSVTGIVKANNQRDLLTMQAYDLIYDYLVEHDMLWNNKAKIFNVSGFFKVDTEEKFKLYRSYFLKIRDYLNDHKEQYNAMDLFFADSILKSENLKDYMGKYSPSVAIAFLKRGKR